MMKDVVTAIKHQLPKFNDHLIRGLREREFDNLIEFIADGYRGCAKVISPDLVLLDYRVVSPVERLQSELRIPKALNTVNISVDEAALVAYRFQYHDVVFENMVYVPYLLEDGSVSIGGTRYECLLGMTEKSFSVEPDNTGFTIKLIRFPASFWRTALHGFKDMATDKSFIGNVVYTRLHQKFPPKAARRRPTALLYLMCRHSIEQVLGMFGFPSDSVVYDNPSQYDPNYYYFRAQKLTKSPTLLRVNKELMDDNHMFRSVVATLVYILDSSQLSSFENMIADSQMVYKIILGKLIYSNNLKREQALNNMEKHLESVDDFMDSYTRSILATGGIVVKDIYELLVYVICNIDRIIMSNAPNNLFNKKLEVVNGAVIGGMFEYLYRQAYSYEIKDDHNYMVNEVVTKALRTKPRQILKTLNMADNVRFNPSVQSDNWLITIGAKIVKRLSVMNMGSGKKASSGGIKSPVNRFHPSMAIVESMYGLGSSPGVNSLLNPYCQVNEVGVFVKDAWAAKIEKELNGILQGYK